MSRISHRTPLAGFDHVATLLKDAAGSDGVLSKRDANKLVKNLKSEGRDVEALAAGNIFKLLDKRDAAAGARVTGRDLKEVRTFVKTSMLENRDVDHNGYSAGELARMSKTGKALVEIGEMLKTGGASVEAFKSAFEKMVDPNWDPSRLPSAPASALPAAARTELDGMKERADGDLIDAPVIRKLTVDGKSAFAIAQFMHDSFAVSIYDAAGKRLAHGDGWGSPRLVDWER